MTEIEPSQEEFISVKCEDLPTVGAKDSVELQALWRQLSELCLSYAKLNEKMPADLISAIKTPQDIDYITDTIAVHLNLTIPERQELLELRNLGKRILKLCSFLQREIEILLVEQKIR
jgi:ATP-dependent Lon protease